MEMDPRYSGRDYNYPELAKQHWANPSGLPSEGNNNDSQSQADILHNFPYLRQGFTPRFSQQPQHPVPVSSTAHSLNTSVVVKNSYVPQTFAPTTDVDPYANSSSMPSFMGAVRPLAGRLPDVSTFNTSLSHMQHQMSNPMVTPAFSSPDEPLPPKTYQPTMQGLTTASGLVDQSSCSMTNPSSLNLNSNELVSSSDQSLPSIFHVINKELQRDMNRKSSSQGSKEEEHFGAISTMAEVAPVNFLSDSILYDSSQKHNVDNNIVTNASSGKQFSSVVPMTGESGMNSSQYGGKSTFPNEQAGDGIKEEKGCSRVKFFLKGHLSPKPAQSLKSPKEILNEPVDSEETFYDNVVFNSNSSARNSQNARLNGKNLLNRSYDFKPSYKKTAMKLYESKLLQKKTVDMKELPNYTEPSIAELRQDAMKIEKGAFGKFPEDFGANDSSGGKATEPPSSGGGENKNSEFEVIDGDLNFNWYSAAMKKYASVNNNEAPIEAPSPIKRGGRSDPDNPFAITSPSFSESAARAVITTTNCSTGTIVSISIMSIGSRKKLIPNITNSEAARGGLVSISNPMETSDETTATADSEEGGELKLEKTSIMSKLNREKKEKEDAEEESKDTNIDHLDVDVHVADTQCIDQGDQKRWQCKLCPKLYTTKHNLVSHILDHGGIKPHLCLVCGKYFKQLSHLNTHMLTHDMVKPHKCTICNKGFTQVSHLKRHQAVHSETKPQTYVCSTCNRGFAFPSELKAHQERHLLMAEIKRQNGEESIDGEDDSLQCCYCKRVFSFPSQLRDHMMTHAGARPYICTECGMDFMKDHHLKAHLFTHTGLRPYSCPHCSRSFNQKANMVRHMLIHNSERAFKCEVCSKTFTQPQTLKAHMVVHADKKPYACKYCGKQFGRLHNLQGHLHIHSDSKPYVCSMCQSTFTLKGNLNRHKKVKHGLNESTENMEEDAVNFLSSLSDRVRDGSMDPDQDSRDDGMSSGMSSPSLKKGRKSVPRKRVSQQVFVGHEDCGGGGAGSDWEASSDIEMDDKVVGVSYSDEERENEERLGKEVTSKYFGGETEDDAKPRRKRKQNICHRFDGEDDDDDGGNHGNVESVGANVEEVDGESNDTIDLDYSIVKTEIDLSDYTGDADAGEQRAVRKRRKKPLEDGFLDDNDNNEEELGNGGVETSVKSRRKGDILDTIIATKFSSA